ncbi:hypothetical protein AUC47_10250 [Microbacterium sp. SZ1]|uniref:hypothetical protein n=1 Tax=Microbacterium sp. SZ1 TaxID=1849736 RepID=UPI000BBBCAD5|nr:hypothetical protein [Microbacterium sp. SZ1]PCE15898.1 hypothetical protein AUC47_10250 [Microbacterium sp. SZ1]
MGITRPALDFEEKFTRIPNAWIRDSRLSRRARGLLAELLSHRAGWRVSIRSLVSEHEKKHAVAATIAELIAAGYLTVGEQRRSASGTFGEAEYVLSDPTVTRSAGHGAKMPVQEGEIRPPSQVAFKKTPDETVTHSAVDGSPVDGSPGHKEDHLEEDHHEEGKIRSDLIDPTRSQSSDRSASEAQKRYVRDLWIHLHGAVPSADIEASIDRLTASEVRPTVAELNRLMPRFTEYEGPEAGDPAYDALSPVGRDWADRQMVPE